MKRYIFALFLVTVAFSASYNSYKNSTCLSYNNNTNKCTSWKIVGYSLQDVASCFPANAFVKTELGFKTFQQLRIGDKILGYHNNKESYSFVYGWLHREIDIQAQYLNLTINNINITVSAKHNIAIKQGQYIFAELTLNQTLFNQNIMIQKITKTNAKGKFAPYTQNNNYFVYPAPTDQFRILAHDFAHIRDPVLYQKYIHSLFQIYNVLFTYQGNTSHPLFFYLSKLFRFLIE